MKLRQFATTINAPAPKEVAPVKQAAPTPKPKPAPRKALEHHVTGAIERGEAEPIIAVELDRTTPTPDVLAWAQAHTTATTIDVVGENPPDLGWVWLTYSEKPERAELDMLKANGFRWASRRKQWAHPCGLFRPSSRGKVNPYQKYAVANLKDED